ncbi:hypothetical protein [Streptomyces sp. NPDC127066]|uniref:8-oxoguanine DNA glycosylase OGG fold protein n=1 Tax=Streptomyces sp. NPDC127066 TaxID=3347125 RepID=UPI00364D58D6
MPVVPDDARLPDREAVLGQAIPFDRARWISQLPDSTWWPDALEECPQTGRWPRVDRRTVFSIARRADTAEGRRHLLVAALLWGNGTKVRSVRRSARVFQNSTRADLGARLYEALDVLREQGAVAAYRAFNNDQHIPYLGPAFFTKVLYFAGHESAAAHHRPVILDSVVSRALRATGTVEAGWPDNGWTTAQYGRYVAMVHDCAQARGVLPDQVEAALFSYGKRL